MESSISTSLPLSNQHQIVFNQYLRQPFNINPNNSYSFNHFGTMNDDPYNQGGDLTITDLPPVEEGGPSINPAMASTPSTVLTPPSQGQFDTPSPQGQVGTIPSQGPVSFRLKAHSVLLRLRIKSALSLLHLLRHVSRPLSSTRHVSRSHPCLLAGFSGLQSAFHLLA